MVELEIHQEEKSGTVTLRLEGTIDATTVLQLRQSLEALSSDEVVIDFSRVKQFRDLAVAVLSRGLQGRSVQMRGLGEHQERMFRYFGLTSSPGPRAMSRYYTPEEQIAV